MPIRVLLVEDSPVALAILEKILRPSPHIEIVGTARTGIEALELIPQRQPQVICTDLHMPHMDGLALTTEIMSRFPIPILVISVSVHAQATQQIFHLLEAGAVDVFPKPVAGLSPDNQLLNQALIEKIRILSGVKVFRKPRSTQPSSQRLTAQLSSHSASRYSTQAHTPLNSPLNSQANSQLPAHHQRDRTQPLPKRPKIIVIGASTGGPTALQEILSHLPPPFLPVICVQHISQGFLQGLIDWLQQTCALSIKIAQPRERPFPGCVYFPAENQHLALDDHGLFTYLDSPPVDGHRPSITYTFEALANYYGPCVVGVLLTGMGEDGATGLKAIAQVGGLTLAQDEATSVIFGMPQAAIRLGGVSQVLPIEAIAPTLIEFVHRFPLASAVG